MQYFDLLGSTMVGVDIPTIVEFQNEKDKGYSRIKKIAEQHGFFYHRLETAKQDGMPDCLVTRGGEYYFIEVKFLRKKQLVKIENDLSWEFGQLAFLKRCVLTKTNYLLFVIMKEKQSIWITREFGRFPSFIYKI